MGDPKVLTNPKKHPLWVKFVELAREENVNLEHEEDWLDWWKFFLHGAAAQLELSK